MLATPIIYRISLATPGCKATPEHVDLLKMPESRYEVETVVRGYHVYMGIWDAAIGETLECEQEGKNIHDPYAVAVVKGGNVVGHVPRAISSVCFLFLKKNGKIKCLVTGKRQRSVDLPTGGLEVPCKLIFTCSCCRLIAKTEKLLSEAVSSGLLKPCTNKRSREKGSTEQECEHPAKKLRSPSDKWLKFNGEVLLQKDKKELCNGGWLNDKHINYVQLMLKSQFPSIDGWKCPLLLNGQMNIKIQHGVQIIHSRGNHWIVASNLRCHSKQVQVFDSLYTTVDDTTRKVIENIFAGKSTLEMVTTQASWGK